jgi:sugar lactone lactonase YvrE
VRDVDLSTAGTVKVTRIAGTPYAPGTIDGTNALFQYPNGVALDAGGTTLFIADAGNHLVRRLNLGTRSVDTPIGHASVALTKPGPLPGYVHTPFGVLATPRGLVITSVEENTLLLATGL